jgi:hypothetical protein
MPAWARLIIFTGGAAAAAVSVLTVFTLDSIAGEDHVRAFLGLWLGALSVIGAVAGPWVRTSRLLDPLSA